MYIISALVLLVCILIFFNASVFKPTASCVCVCVCAYNFSHSTMSLGTRWDDLGDMYAHCVNMYKCRYIYIYIYIHVYIYIYIYIYMYLYIYINMHTRCMHVCTSCNSMHSHTAEHRIYALFLPIYRYICMCTYIYVCIFIYMYIHTHVHLLYAHHATE